MAPAQAAVALEEALDPDHRVELERILVEGDRDVGLADGHADLFPLESDGANEQLRP